jgi:hypothetical protein
MDPESFVIALVLGAAALALWTDLRFPGLGPRSITARLVNAGIAALVVIVAPVPSQPGMLQILAVLGLFLPALGYAFLTGLWLLRSLQGALLRG